MLPISQVQDILTHPSAPATFQDLNYMLEPHGIMAMWGGGVHFITRGQYLDEDGHIRHLELLSLPTDTSFAADMRYTVVSADNPGVSITIIMEGGTPYLCAVEVAHVLIAVGVLQPGTVLG